MRWYEGGIAEAVAASKKKNAIFVVYVEGTDDTSTRITNLINEEEISKQLESNNFVAIKIEADSVSHQQFSQIYKQVSVPSLYFIGKNGVPLEIITSIQNSNDFITKINTLLHKNGYDVTVASNAAKESDVFIKTEQNSLKTEQPSPNVVCENGVCTLKRDEPSTSQQDELTAEEKIERAKLLIDQKRENKEKEEKESERNKELERRKVGQEVQKLKRWQEDQELKQLKEERDREKREQQAARDRVLAQIAQDKADRAARFGSSVHQQQQQQQQTSPQLIRRSPVNSNTARLQFKLPDGSTHAKDFSSTDTLDTVRNYIITNMNLPFNNFLLSTTFPRREFTNNDNCQSLADLNLVPNAVILVLPISHGTIATNAGGGFAAMFWTILSPLLNIFGYLKNLIFGPSHNKNDSNSRETAERPSENVGEHSRIPPKRRSGEATVVRREGNIHRLSDKTDSDDENNTWNGNSTQQM